jgi:hypothetical protein
LFAPSAGAGPSAGAAQDVPPQIAPSGALRIKTDVSDVQVILDNKDSGRTPFTNRSVSPGSHRITLAKEGYEDHVQDVDVSSSKTTSLFIVMKPVTTPLPALPVEFKVMHQHRFGYCVGVLTVSADALDYKADKDEDRFHIEIKTLKSVSRSWGALVGMGPSGINAPTDGMAFRIEAPGRSYGFLAYKDEIGELMAVASIKTKELFEVVYRLWTATLKPRS